VHADIEQILEDRIEAQGDLSGRTVTLLPDPEPAPRLYPIVSVDDHLIEPPDLFDGRMPAAYQHAAPRVVDEPDGSQAWHFEDRVFRNIGLNAVAGRPVSESTDEPRRFDEMRPGCWKIGERVRDMDLNGIDASVTFPSQLTGFGGQRFAQARDLDLGLATMRAWNSWHLDAWAGPSGGRIIPCQIPWLADADVAAAEIRANAELGFRAVTFPELPDRLGLPSIHSGYWHPFLAACEETETVICLHVGSASTLLGGGPESSPLTVNTLFAINSMVATTDWLFSPVALSFPAIKILMAESGISWLAALIDRLNFLERFQMRQDPWRSGDVRPIDVLRRNFWFSAVDDQVGFRVIDAIGTDRVMVESDYPHADSTWPHTQEVVRRQIESLTEADRRRVTSENALSLFRWAL
jgi:predicted TIM-barrel fold metal-dependent hydrolase